MRNFASSILRLFLMAIFLPWWQNRLLRNKSWLPKGVHEVFAGSMRTLLAELLDVYPLIVVAFSPLDFGEASKMLWELISPLVQLFHPQSSGQVERVNQILEDMLRACVISFGKNWEKS